MHGSCVVAGNAYYAYIMRALVVRCLSSLPSPCHYHDLSTRGLIIICSACISMTCVSAYISAASTHASLCSCRQLVGISSPTTPCSYLSPSASCEADTMQPSKVHECTSSLQLRKLILKSARVSPSNARSVACQYYYHVTPCVFKPSRKA